MTIDKNPEYSRVNTNLRTVIDSYLQVELSKTGLETSFLRAAGMSSALLSGLCKTLAMMASMANESEGKPLGDPAIAASGIKAAQDDIEQGTLTILAMIQYETDSAESASDSKDG